MSLPELHPVIHHLNMATTLRNAEVASLAGCPGIFLIHMGGLDHLLDEAILEIRRHFPLLQVGVNRLVTDPVAAIRRNVELGADSTWSDTCGITSDGIDTEGAAIQRELTAQRHTAHRFFGSIAFKYQRPEPDPARAAQLAAEAGFIPTTSGAATGLAPAVSKLATMAHALQGGPLALASGINPENAAQFVPFVRYFLVSTGISRSFYDFDALRVQQLMRVIADGRGNPQSHV